MVDFDILLKKYDESFDEIVDKKLFFDFVHNVRESFGIKKDLNDFYKLLEDLYKEYTSLNKKVPVNIMDLLFSFFDTSEPRKIDSDEFSLIIKSIKEFILKKDEF